MRTKYIFSSRRTGRIEGTNKHRKPYPSIAKEVIKISDIVLEILDARFIGDTRNKELENLIIKSGKRLIYVLNKSDLVDINSVKRNVELESMNPFIFISCKNRRGISDLRTLIKIEAKKEKKDYSRAQVGVIGYPNTGKSSVINILVGRFAAKTAAEAGFTRGMQKVRMTKGVLIIDTPGVIPEKETGRGQRNSTKHVQISAKMWDKAKDPDIIAFELMKKYPEIEKFYGFDSGKNFDEFIEALGRKMNYLKRGNLVDTDKTSRKILRDWQEGKIRQG